MKKILYIDDEADTLKMMSKFEVMSEEGIEILKVTRINEVLPTIREFRNQIGLIVLDIIMPPEEFYGLEETNGGTTTGLRLLEDIRGEVATVPIIIVSIRRMNVASDEINKFNISEYIEKPVETPKLLEAIRRYAQK